MTLDLRKEEDIHAAFHVADKEGSEVLVERFIPASSTACWWWAAAWWRPRAVRSSSSPATARTPCAS